MVSVNGNFDKGRFFFAKDVEKKDVAETKVEKAVVEEKQPEFKERGEELLAATMFGKAINFFTVNEQIDKETADELSEMFAMAGISHRLPTAQEYARIAGITRNSIAQFTPLETERHVEELFANPNLLYFLAEETNF